MSGEDDDLHYTYSSDYEWQTHKHDHHSNGKSEDGTMEVPGKDQQQYEWWHHPCKGPQKREGGH